MLVDTHLTLITQLTCLRLDILDSILTTSSDNASDFSARLRFWSILTLSFSMDFIMLKRKNLSRKSKRARVGLYTAPGLLICLVNLGKVAFSSAPIQDRDGEERNEAEQYTTDCSVSVSDSVVSSSSTQQCLTEQQFSCCTKVWVHVAARNRKEK